MVVKQSNVQYIYLNVHSPHGQIISMNEKSSTSFDIHQRNLLP